MSATINYPTIEADPASVVTLYPTPGPHPNGLQATHEGLWCLDQHNNHLHLLDPATGAVRVDLATESDRGSGVTDDGTHLWLASTYNRKILKIDRNSGATLAEFATPGAEKTGAHGLEWRDGKLWVATPPSATVYQLDPDHNCTVVKSFPAPGNRPHGLAWHGDTLWLVETNHRAIYAYDYTNGNILAKLQLPTDAPEPHGMTIWEGNFLYCDADAHIICSVPVPPIP